MIVQVQGDKLVVEFPLSQPKSSWRVRSKKRRGRRGWKKDPNLWIFRPTFGDLIYEGDIFEWMISNEELREILYVAKCMEADYYEEIKKAIHNLNKFESHVDITLGWGVKIEGELRPKQKKGEELTPWFFILFPLDRSSNVYYLKDAKNNKIENPINRKIRAGDRLVWVVDLNWLKTIILKLAGLSEDHKEKIIKEVFEPIDNLKL